MKTHETIQTRRLELGLSESEVASQTGISIHEYGDIEQYAEEFTSVLPLSAARRLCEVLGLDMLRLIGLDSGSTPNAPVSQPISQLVPRNEQVSQGRNALGISRDQLAERLGFEEEILEKIESDPQFLETLPIELAIALAKELVLPPQFFLKPEKSVES